MTKYTHISVERSHNDRVATVTMRRAEVRNALNAHLATEMREAFSDLRSDTRLHAVVLTGDGSVFSAGADLNAMKASATFSQEQNLQDALAMSDLFKTVNTFPCAVIGRVNGAAMGGGLGLVAACDIAIAVDSAKLSFSEVRLGIAPAVISPYVLHKIGESQARMLFLTGEFFSVAYAREIGLVHIVTTAVELDAAVEIKVGELLKSAPLAIRACKALALNVGQMDSETARRYTAETIARLRVSEEGQEGLQAFLEKRKPSWIE
jgi:methylglutaconyl-CoA hydratase